MTERKWEDGSVWLLKNSEDCPANSEPIGEFKNPFQLWAILAQHPGRELVVCMPTKNKEESK